MARCTNCDSLMILGGTKVGSLTFCGAKCAALAPLYVDAEGLGEVEVEREVQRMRQAPCPVCQGPGPVDIYTSYRVYSVLVMTSWRNLPRVSCRGCARKAQAMDAGISLVAGWWGIPWGFIMTPVQLGRNVVGMMGNPAEDAPTPAFKRRVRLLMAAQAPNA